jgi:RNA polymerase sigma factor (sigma-70 family)
MSPPSSQLLAAIERSRKRLWALCYRMTGERADADDLAQEAIAKAIERCDQLQDADPTAWLMRSTARLCIDHLRHRKIVRRVSELVDPLAGGDWSVADQACAPDCRAILREDMRFAVVVALQLLSSRQRAAVILHDVCSYSLDEVADTLETNANAVKALLQRARVALREARIRDDIDVPADRTVVEQFAAAIEAGSIEALTALLAEDVWGIVDGGGVVQVARKPSFGRRAVSRQWSNGKRRLNGLRVTARVVSLNGEPTVVIRLADAPDAVVAVVHIETRAGRINALRVSRDPHRTARLLGAQAAVHPWNR